MCRMCYIPANSLGVKEAKYLLVILASNQPHGAGLLAWRPHCPARHVVQLDNYRSLIDEAIDLVDGGWSLLAHFRTASIGSICVELCQPFWSAKKRIGLCHNGHANGYAAIARYLVLVDKRPWSDSKVMYHLLCEYTSTRLKKQSLLPHDGVWFVLRDRKITIWYESGQLEYSCGVWASEFPRGWKLTSVHPEYGTYNGSSVPKEKIVQQIGFRPVDRMFRFVE